MIAHLLLDDGRTVDIPGEADVVIGSRIVRLSFPPAAVPGGGTVIGIRFDLALTPEKLGPGDTYTTVVRVEGRQP